MKVTAVPIVIGAIGTVTKGLVQRLKNLEIRGRVETIQTPALLRLVRILKKVLEASDSSEKPSANAGVKNSQKSKIRIINFV